jgi:hypothetical protein
VTNPNAEIVRRLTDALWKERDLDVARNLIHPEADFDWSDSRAPYHGHFKGHAELTRAFEVLMDAWDEWDPQFEEVIEVDRDTVLIVTHIQSKGEALHALGLADAR